MTQRIERTRIALLHDTRKEQHRAFAETNAKFRTACRKANTAPTRRQAAKFWRGEGIAFKVTHEAE